VLSINSASITVLEGLRWRPFSGVGQAVFFPSGLKARGEEIRRNEEEEEEEEEAEHDIVSTISFIQGNLQHSTDASDILTKVVSGKVMDMALIQEP
jgi:hypothetical protein